jgi:hypothetical protein
MVDLRACGMNFDKIRKHLRYVLKVRNRAGEPWSRASTVVLYEHGPRIMTDTAARDRLAGSDLGDPYDGVVQLEGESP